MEEQVQKVRKEIVTYLIITFVLSTPIYVLIALKGMMPAGYALMWCPGIAALITRLFYHRNLRGLGWGWGKTRYQVLAYFLPALYNLVPYSLAWVLGLGGITDQLTPNVATIVSILLTAVIGVLPNCVVTLGEEIGWRGLLVPQLAKLTTFTKASLITGVIWAVWHWPAIVFGDYRTALLAGSGGEEAPIWYALLCFTLFVIGLTFVFNWIRLKSGSVWTAMFLHAAQNKYLQGILDPVTTNTGITPYILGEFGIATALSALVVGWVFWRKRTELPDTRLNPETEAAMQR